MLCPKSQVTYEALVKLPIVEKFEEAFRRATGVAMKLMPAGAPAERVAFGGRQNDFCRMLAGNRTAGEACWKSEAEIQRRVGETLTAQTIRCFAGMKIVAVPVMVQGRHLATWIGGQVLCRKPTRANFKGVAEQLAKWGMRDELRQIKSAFLGSRVVPGDQLQAMKQLLTLFAQHLGEYADRLWAVPRASEPLSVTRAKEFIQARFTEPVNLTQLAEAVHVSPFHFCRVFRAATGLTFTEYVSRLRVERAKTLLADRFVRVSEVAYATGFGSISQFNTVFRRCVGKTPTEYRTAP
jgi:AraC-like DNA-binding protein/ligand-binding sensor protein